MRMIKKIKRIDGFRCFTPFIWDENNCELFGHVNIIYGWNGAGKSTLGTFFHHFERKAQLPTSVSLELSYQDESDTIRKFSSQPSEATLCPICVYYDKYIEENLKKHDGIRPIFVIGKEQSAKVEAIASLTSRIDEVDKKQTKLDNAFSLARKEYDDYCKKQASLIKNEVKLTAAYNKNSYESDCKNGCIAVKKEEYETAKAAINAEQRKEIKFAEPQAIDQTILKTLENLFEESPIHKALDELNQDAILSTWVFQGLRLHSADESICKFCGSPISSTRRTELEDHFNRAYNTCVEKLSKTNTYLNLYAQQLELYCQQLPSNESLYIEFRKEYEKAVDDLCTAIRSNAKLCRNVCSIIDRKQIDITNTAYADEYRTKWTEWIDLVTVISKVTAVIAKHNKRCKDNSSYVAAAKETIKKYWISVTYPEWQNKSNACALAEKQVGENKTNLSALKDQREKLNREIRNSKISVDRINTDIKFLMGRQELLFEDCENGYRITRDGVLADHLSKGEENAIALIYFFNSLKDESVTLADTIVVLDDPISSFDSNFYYNAISYIKDKLQQAGQIFILTHKFSLLQDYRKMYSDSELHLYQIERGSTNTVIHSMDPMLETYYDEYAYLFKSIYNFVKAPPRNKSEYFIYPNIARRVLESFLMFKLPKAESTLLDKAQTLAGDKNDPCLRSIMRLINNKSHLQVIPSKDYSDRSDELNALPEILKNLLMFMRFHDECHFDTLAKQFMPTYTETTFCMDILKEGLPPKTKVKLYSMAVCAGEGFEPEDDRFAYEEKEVDISVNESFDYGVRISGKSMEPKIPDGSVVLVKKQPVEINNKDIVICIYESECMCKRYIQTETNRMLTSENRDKEQYPNKILAEGVECVFQGKVVKILSPNDIE